MSDNNTSTARRDQRARDDDATSVRHLRIRNGSWRAAAARAKRDGVGLAAAVGELVAAYGAGAIDLPTSDTPDRVGAPTRSGVSGPEQVFDRRPRSSVPTVVPTGCPDPDQHHATPTRSRRP